MNKENFSEWRIIGESVVGASHLRSNTPNQDAIFQVRESSRSLPLILAIADGHGSAKCFRSDTGSRFAVKKSATLVGEFLDARRGKFDAAEIEAEGSKTLPAELVKRWRKAVDAHLKENPFTEEEFKKLEEKSGAASRKLIEQNPHLAYGTTTLTAAVEEDFIVYLQLGDGDILNISETGEVRRALPEDARLFANETTSLCLPNAEKDFRFHVQKMSADNRPALVMLSTDGYVNSFSEEAGFLQAGTDFLQLLGSEGHDFISGNLKTWLEETTQTGSGDDTTVGLIYRPDALKKPSKNPEETNASKAQNQAEKSADKTSENAENSAVKNDDSEDVVVTVTIKKDKNKLLTPHVETKQIAGLQNLKDGGSQD